jgi:hypothetical protein
MVRRKHTRFGEMRFSHAIGAAVSSLASFREAESRRIARLKETPLAEETAESLMLRAYFEKGIVSGRQHLIRNWRTPAFDEFREKNLWSLFNAFTRILAELHQTNPQLFVTRTMQLHQLLYPLAGSDGASMTPVATPSLVTSAVPQGN